MTCVVAVVEGDGSIHFGCDSLGSNGHSQTVLTDPKIFRNGESLIGFTGSFRMGQLLQHSFVLPDKTEGQTEKEYLVTSFMDSARMTFKLGGFGYHADGDFNEEGGDVGGDFLLGYRGNLYMIQSDYALLHAVDDFAAIGSGEEPANAVLFATRGLGMDPTARLQLALEAAAYQISSVKPPFHFMSMDVPKPKPKRAAKKKVAKKKTTRKKT